MERRARRHEERERNEKGTHRGIVGFDGGWDGGLRRGKKDRAPLVITVGTAESFVCALLPQSIVAQRNVPPPSAIVPPPSP